MFKILQVRLQQYMNREIPDVKLDLEKAAEPEIKLPTSAGSSKKQQFQKNIYFCFIDCVDHNKLWKILKDDAVKGLHSICQQIWKTQQWPQDFQSQGKAIPKNAQTTAQLHSSHMLAK